MATTKPTTYPKIPRKIWWLLRSRFKQSLPSAVTPTYITALSPMADASARSNVIAPLRELHLLDDTNKPTTLAAHWRNDEDYANTCKQILAKVYPSELLEAFPSATGANKAAIQNWFMKVGHVGQAAAKMYTDTFLLLSEADPKGGEQHASKTGSAAAKKLSTAKAGEKKTAASRQAPAAADPPAPQLPSPPMGQAKHLPSIHIDVQVHISPDTTPEQIDRIFESMSKHLGSFVK